MLFWSLYYISVVRCADHLPTRRCLGDTLSEAGYAFDIEDGGLLDSRAWIVDLDRVRISQRSSHGKGSFNSTPGITQLLYF